MDDFSMTRVGGAFPEKPLGHSHKRNEYRPNYEWLGSQGCLEKGKLCPPAHPNDFIRQLKRMLLSDMLPVDLRMFLKQKVLL